MIRWSQSHGAQSFPHHTLSQNTNDRPAKLDSPSEATPSVLLSSHPDDEERARQGQITDSSIVASVSSRTRASFSSSTLRQRHTNSPPEPLSSGEDSQSTEDDLEWTDVEQDSDASLTSLTQCSHQDPNMFSRRDQGGIPFHQSRGDSDDKYGKTPLGYHSQVR